MKQILIQIADILWQVPNSNEDTVATIMNPIDTMEEAKRMLEYLQENKSNLKIGYLIKHSKEIIMGDYMILTNEQKEVIKELDFQSTAKGTIQHILAMLDTPAKVDQMKNYLVENHDKTLSQNQIILKANQIQHGTK